MRPSSRVLTAVGRAAAACAATSMLLLGTAAPVTATHASSDSVDEVSALIAKVGQAEQKLADLGAQIQRRQEDVNRALLEVSTRREEAAEAFRDAATSRRNLDETAAAIAAAQRRFDALAVSSYVNGPSGSLIDATNPQEVIEATSASTTLAMAFRQAQIDLQRARTEHANRESSARAAQDKANATAGEAQRSLDAAVSTLTAAQGDFDAQRDQLTLLVAQRDSARTRLEAAHRKSAADANWDLADTNVGWDTTVPAVPSANVTGDPIAIINSLLQISAASAQLTADLGRKFLTQLGILRPAAAAADSGITNGRIPYVNGREASEYVIRRAMTQIGVPYSWGGGSASGPTRGIDSGSGTVGFDCSGLMLYAFAGVGIKLPHYSGSQYNAGRKIPAAQMRRGDLIFWGANASQHEAMYLGDGMMLEAQQTGVPVKVSPVRTSGMMPYVTRLIEY
ncbi:NlpC/P60 family protein [Mycobacterium sp. CVI_P3]|uniref:NlpC/P60 family protein n=1 Tax=Mycobacterium pinniadriaticum TaxID=2994102 RepID=A0ABT3S7P4_9MYCO|nr:NlpC/P60 family protein [Mycobacterium pinniadriaticum]MCX2929100.1 NlpC/P60 family protein [Mycobacterium pinniadriaticum]MCX2935525.1 NlpC/P60 family protein [Mycobacterium pinniadriaticum]